MSRFILSWQLVMINQQIFLSSIVKVLIIFSTVLGKFYSSLIVSQFLKLIINLNLLSNFRVSFFLLIKFCSYYYYFLFFYFYSFAIGEQRHHLFTEIIIGESDKGVSVSQCRTNTTRDFICRALVFGFFSLLMFTFFANVYCQRTHNEFPCSSVYQFPLRRYQSTQSYGRRYLPNVSAP